jgi:hypothetical protein
MVREEPNKVADLLKVTPPLAKLTAGKDRFSLWVKGAAVDRVLENRTYFNSNAIIQLGNGIQFGVAEDVPTARRILNEHGGKIGSTSGSDRKLN